MLCGDLESARCCGGFILFLLRSNRDSGGLGYLLTPPSNLFHISSY